MAFGESGRSKSLQKNSIVYTSHAARRTEYFVYFFPYTKSMDEKSLIQRNFNKMNSQTMVFAKQKAYRKAEISSFKDGKF